MALGTLRSIKVTATIDGTFHSLDWRYGQEPTIVSMSNRADSGDLARIATAPEAQTELVALAERVVDAARQVLAKTPLDIASLEYSTHLGHLSGAAYWANYGVPAPVPFKPETLEKIKAALATIMEEN